MTDITGISQAFATEFGFTAQFWGYILGAVVVVAVLICISWATDGSSFTTAVSAFVAVGIVSAIGWFDMWLIVFISLVIVLMLVFGTGAVSIPSFSRGGGGA